MIKELTLNEFIQEFKDYNRDNFSYDGYEGLFNYYNEFENFKLDVIAICCDVSEYERDEFINDYGSEEEFKEFKNDNKDIYDDEEEFKEEYAKELFKELEKKTTIIKLNNGNFLIWNY